MKGVKGRGSKIATSIRSKSEEVMRKELSSMWLMMSTHERLSWQTVKKVMNDEDV